MRTRWIGLRNRLLGDARFRRWALRFPLTRGIARRRAAGLFDLVTGFVHSQVLAAGVELGVFERLRDAPATAAALAGDVPLAAFERWLRAAATLGLVEPLPEGRWTLGSHGAALAAEPGIAAMVAHHRLLYADLADPVALLRRGRGGLADYWAYADATPARVAGYSALMAASQPMVAEQLLGAWPGWPGARRLLDIGGGEGAFARVATTRHPDLHATVFDLPAVARRVVATTRVSAVGGSFVSDRPPDGFDLVTLVRILHDHDDEAAMAGLRAARAALAPGGALLIAEPMAGTPAARRMGDAYFGMYLLAMGSGEARSAATLAAMARAAGFGRVREVPTANPLICRVLEARS